jgi:hypothetical protein
MAWRIEEQVVRGIIDNTVNGRVTGEIWLISREEPIRLELAGNTWRDLAGTSLEFLNPNPKLAKGPDTSNPKSFFPLQKGVVGDITASRKVRVPDIPLDEVGDYYARREPFPWHWGNSLYLEWYSQANGRVVIECATYELKIDPEPVWWMSEAEEIEQRKSNSEQAVKFLERIGELIEQQRGLDESHSDSDSDLDPDSELGLSEAERQADEEAARMDTLLDRIQARLEREGLEDDGGDHFERIMQEEREKLRRERGEPEPEPLTPEQEAERQAWLEELNQIAEEVVAGSEAESWKSDADSDPDSDSDERDRHHHPLGLIARELASQFHQDIQKNEWLKETDIREHPLEEVRCQMLLAAGKLGAALVWIEGEDEFEATMLGHALVRLKKTREALQDVLAGLDGADEQDLATPNWRSSARMSVNALLNEVEQIIARTRDRLS